ncbi:MAG: histidinol-phosphate phosphatase [Streptosporangiaceae bacterium]|jgi:histidinol-phosphatase|nr:histidinol-phosphate phosphatase [Streptosporangiaceae bacterium]
MDDLTLAQALADRADEITLLHFDHPDLRVQAKPDRSLVTQVDIETEAALRALLAEHRPGDGVLGEEAGETTGDAVNSRRWILDPLDYTSNYVRGIPVFATLIALESAGEIVVGVVSAPAMGRRWWAARGQGAYADGRRIKVSGVGTLGEALIGYAALQEWNKRGRVPAITEIQGEANSQFSVGGFWGHMLVAEGRMDAALDPWGEIWDIAPSLVIVEEAGGRVTDLEGIARPDAGCAIVTNGLLHDEILARLG